MKQEHKLTVAGLMLLGLMNIADAQLPDPGVDIVAGRTALLIADPQNDFRSPKGVTRGVVGKSVTALLLPDRPRWKFEGALEKLMHNIGMFDRKGALTTEGFEGSGADWLDRNKTAMNPPWSISASLRTPSGRRTKL